MGRATLNYWGRGVRAATVPGRGWAGLGGVGRGAVGTRGVVRESEWEGHRGYLNKAVSSFVIGMCSYFNKETKVPRRKIETNLLRDPS